jgi:hypothetical protein
VAIATALPFACDLRKQYNVKKKTILHHRVVVLLEFNLVTRPYQ